jgi:dTDP-4-dehydrorhamnose reductase
MSSRPDNNLNMGVLPEIWGGIECTINRIRNDFLDQLEMSGHYSRDSDIDLIAGLGIKQLRFPILWERHEPVKGKPVDWLWTDKRLQQLRQHSIIPIAGLVHHGSGPAFTSLGSKSFATGLAAYAAKVAKRYPWLEYYTPVNEPLTTARFSGLYGYWYPHRKSDYAFCTMLLNQLKSIVLAMQEIKKINLRAKLIQTEDLGKTYSVPSLQYQADFDNDRRWISFDLLCGKVNRDHALWDFFIRSGISEDSLLFFSDNPCPPSILGLNYYVTSERFLDNRLENYPKHMHGGNWLEGYVDTEAVRVNHGQPSGLRILLKEAEERYHLPMAITESHLNCTAEDRMRWFMETWDICCDLNNQGSNIKAVTAWSLFGAFGWNKLLTSIECEYECGVFDLRAPSPRPTAMAKLIHSLCTTKNFLHPALEHKGWWHQDDRFLYRKGLQASG